MKSSYSITEWFTREWFAFFILFLGVIATLLFAVYANRAAISKEEIQFTNFVQRTEETVANELDTYVALLLSSSGQMETNENTTAQQFRTFVERLNLRERYPGVQGLGYALRVQREELEAFQTQMQLHNPTYTVNPEYEREEYYPIVFIEPLDQRNQSVLGYDMSTEDVRWQAMQQARDTGQPVASGRVTLRQEKADDMQPGFLIYSPIYSGQNPPRTAEERRQRLLGFIYSPFRAQNFMKALPYLQTTNAGLHFAVYDSTEISPETFLYSNSDTPVSSTTPFYQTRTVSAAGRAWTLEFWSTPNFGDSVERDLVPIILSGGLTISFLVFVLARSQYRALLEAQRRSAELRISQQELRQSRGQYQLVVENTEDLVNLLDMEGRYIYASPSHEKITGYSSSELLEKRLLDFVHQEDVKKVEKELAKISTGKTMKTVYRFRHRRGHYLSVEGVGSGITDEAGVPYVMVTTSRDITQRVELEQKKDEFISIASHELKTPVTSIKAYAQYLKVRFLKQGDTQASGLLEKMDHQLNKLTVLISDLLDVSKIEAGKLQMHREYFDLNELTAEVVEEVQRTTDTHTISLEGRVIRKLYGDRERVGQVIINFLSNAIKYSPDGKFVTVILSASATHATVRVKDNGIGIPREKQRKLFTRFFRVDGNKQETYPGLGLGLYISAQIIRRHKGKIWVESEPGNGSAFCFTLPFRKRTTRTQPSSKTRPKKDSRKSS
jgi:PAS domain S-box-containing protein